MTVLSISGGKKGTSMILCFYRKEVETFKEKHKIIDVPNSHPNRYMNIQLQFFQMRDVDVSVISDYPKKMKNPKLDVIIALLLSLSMSGQII
jgi:hypothetical protein